MVSTSPMLRTTMAMYSREGEWREKEKEDGVERRLVEPGEVASMK